MDAVEVGEQGGERIVDAVTTGTWTGTVGAGRSKLLHFEALRVTGRDGEDAGGVAVGLAEVGIEHGEVDVGDGGCGTPSVLAAPTPVQRLSCI